MIFLDPELLKPILKGKPTTIITVPDVTMKLQLEAGSITHNNEWVDKFISAVDVKVAVDSTIIYQDTISSGQINLEFTLPNQAAYTEHVMTITVNGLDVFRPDWSDEINPVIRINSMQIDNCEIASLLIGYSNFASYSGIDVPVSKHIAHDGCQHMPFYTPIYKWIVEKSM